MRLVSLTLGGFLSFQKESRIEFGEGVNIIVGQNGSGKSSVITALKYALCGDILKLKPSELEALRCNVSPNSRTGVVPETFVEVKLDTSDDDDSMGGENEITIRREIHQKKEVLKINGTQVRGRHHLFEIGFHHQNFVVQQGTVMEIASANGEALLKKIEDASGVTNMKVAIDKILNSIQHAQQQLLRIESNSEGVLEIMEMLAAKKQHRLEYALAQDAKQAMDYIFHTRKIEKSRIKLETLMKELELKRKEQKRKAQPFQQEVVEQRKFIAELKVQMENCNAEVIALKEREKILTAARNDIFAIREQEKATISKLLHRKESLDISLSCKRSCVDAEYKIVREEYLKLIRNATDEEQNFVRVNVGIRQVKERIICKTAASSIEEYQSMMETVAMGIEENIRTQETEIADLNENLRVLREQIAHKEKELDLKVSDVQTYKQAIRQSLLKREHINSQIRRNSVELRDNRTRHEDLKATIRCLEEHNEKCHQEMLQVFGLDLAENITGTWNAVQDLSVLDSEFEDSYFGLILDVIDYQEAVGKVVDATADDSFLVTCMVNDAVNAEKLCSYHIKNNLPYSINCMVPEVGQLREQPCLDGVPQKLQRVSELVDIETESDDFKKFLLAKISSGAVICKNFSIAQGAFEEFRNVGITCVTRHGLKLNNSGEVAGGFQDSISRLSCYRRWRNSVKELDYSKRQCESLATEIQKSSAELAQLKSQAGKITSTFNLNNRRFNQGKQDQLCLEIELLCLQKKEESLMRGLVDAELRVTEWKSLIKELWQERTNSVSYSSDITPDIIRLQTLAQAVRKYQKGQKSHSENVIAASAELQRARECVLEEEKALDVDEVLSQSENEMQAKIEESRIYCETLGEQLQLYQDEMTEASQKVCSAAITLQATKVELHKAEYELKDAISRIENMEASSVELESRIQALNEQIAIPWDAAWKEHEVAKFQDMTDSELKHAFIGVTKTLDKLPCDSNILVTDDGIEDDTSVLCHASKQIRKNLVGAITMYSSLRSKVPQVLIKFAKKLENDMQSVFKSVYPNGDIKIVFTSKKANGISLKELDLQEVHQEQLLQVLRDGEINGLKVKASIAEGAQGIYWNAEELSGGQKSIVSLSLILALQKIQPSPLLVFDEVDSALDMKRRLTLSSMITNMSASQQFLCVSFRKEMVESGNKFIKIRFAGSTSVVEDIDKETALDFVKTTEVVQNTQQSSSATDIDSEQLF